MKWQDRINVAKKRYDKKELPFTEDDIEQAQLWITGPLSEHVGKFKTVENNIARGPIDLYLLLDHLYFTKGIEEQDFPLANNCFDSILFQIKALQDGTDRMSMIKDILLWKPKVN